MNPFPRISKNRLKQIAALKQKKVRDEEGLYIAEGEKIVGELILTDNEIISIAATNEWLQSNSNYLKNVKEIYEVNTEELERLSSLQAPNQVLAVIKKNHNKLNIIDLKNKLVLVLDNIQDPGNLGTIIRLADWFGIENIICSENTVELYNPKVIQATMGAFLRIHVFYTDIQPCIADYKKIIKAPVYGALLNGENIYSQQLSIQGLIVMGNESKGISKEIEQLIDVRLTIPSFSQNATKTESLNVAIATSIICSEFKRRF